MDSNLVLEKVVELRNKARDAGCISVAQLIADKGLDYKEAVCECGFRLRRVAVGRWVCDNCKAKRGF